MLCKKFRRYALAVDVQVSDRLISRSGLKAILVPPCAYTHSLHQEINNLQVDLPKMFPIKLEQ